MIIEHIENDYNLRGSFKFNKDGLLIVVSSKINDLTAKNYSGSEGKGAEIESAGISLTHDETKQLANFIVKYYKGGK